RRDVLRRVLGLHRMRFFACKINYDLVEQQVPVAHATESQLLCRQNVPGFSFSSFCAARGVSLPASTSFSNSVSINGVNECHVTYKSYGSGAQFTIAVRPAA